MPENLKSIFGLNIQIFEFSQKLLQFNSSIDKIFMDKNDNDGWICYWNLVD